MDNNNMAVDIQFVAWDRDNNNMKLDIQFVAWDNNNMAVLNQILDFYLTPSENGIARDNTDITNNE
jgi:hypothetical protein